MKISILSKSKEISICLIVFFIIFITSDLLPLLNPAQGSEAYRLLQEGKELYANGEYERALIKFLEAEKAASSPQERVEIFFNLSLGYYSIDQKEDAKNYLGKLFRLYPEKKIDDRYFPSGFLELFSEVKGQQLKPKPKEEETKPVVLGKVGKKKDLKKRKSPWIIIVTVAGVIVLTAAYFSVIPGSIQVNSIPEGAKVFLDNNDTGKTTNCTLSGVSRGNHTIKVVKEGYGDYQQNVSITPLKTTTVNANLMRYSITVTSPNKDSIWIKEKQVSIKWTSVVSAEIGQTSEGASSTLNLPRFDVQSFSPGRQDRELSASKHNDKKRAEIDKKISAKPEKNEASVESLLVLAEGTGQKQTTKKRSEGIIKNTEISGQRLDANNRGLLIKPNARVIDLGLTNVKIDLYKGGEFFHVIVSSTSSNGNYDWVVLDTLPDGADYKVRISCAVDPSIYGESESFRISSSYEFIIKWGSYGSGDGQFSYPRGIAVDKSGYVYVADTSNHRIQKFTSSGSFVTKWGNRGNGDGQFEYPHRVAVDKIGSYAYIADGSYNAETLNRRIQKFTSTGSFITKWGNKGAYYGQFQDPCGVALDNSDDVYVVDREICRVQKFTSTGSFILTWGNLGKGDGLFMYPADIAADPSGNVYVADTSNHRIQKFTSTGTFISKWGSQGSGEGQFIYPMGIAVDGSGYVYVVDYGNHRIQKFTSTGTFITKWGSQGGGDGQFNNPMGIAVDGAGFVYVVEYGNHRIQKFRIKS